MLNRDIVNFANYLADLSAVIIKKYFRTENGEIAKEDDTPVTRADKEIERVIRNEIEKKFPSHGIIGEEYGTHNEDADFVWVLDPIDGTSSFIVGRPIFGTLIGLTHKKKSILGIMNQPITDERWLGIDGEGAWLNGKKIQTRNCRKLQNAIMCASSSFHFKDADEKILKRVSAMTKYQKIGGIIYGGDCYSYASLASGFVDIVIDPGLKVYDYAALLPIVEMAGGIVTDWEGKNPKMKSDVKLVACATQELHEKVLEAING